MITNKNQLLIPAPNIFLGVKKWYMKGGVNMTILYFTPEHQTLCILGSFLYFDHFIKIQINVW